MMKKIIFATLLLCSAAVGFWVGARGGVDYLKLVFVNGASRGDLNSFNAAYKIRKELFGISVIKPDSVVMLGDSITDSIEWGEFVARRVYNRGIGGDALEGMASRLDESLNGCPRSINIMIGVNDLNKNLDDVILLKKASQGMRGVLGRVVAKCPNSRVFLSSILPANCGMFSVYFRAECNLRIGVVKLVNAEYAKLASEFGVHYIDAFVDFLKNEQLDANLSSDGLHLNAAGYRRLIDIYARNGVFD